MTAIKEETCIRYCNGTHTLLQSSGRGVGKLAVRDSRDSALIDAEFGKCTKCQ